MLFTRCPSCDTTFRVTDEALTKAGGQVRCGRCASVFNAYTELRETSVPDEAGPSGASQSHPAAAAPARAPPTDAAKAASQGSAPVTSPKRTTPTAPARSQPPAANVGTAPPSVKPAAKPPAAAPTAGPSAATPAAKPSAPLPPSAATAATPRPSSTSRAGATRAAERLEDLSVAPGVEQPKPGTVEARLDRHDVAHVDDAEHSETPAITAHSVQAVLETEPTSDSTTAIWAVENREASPHDRWWRAGAALGLLVLAAQACHYNRAELASGESVGPWIQRAYSMVGAPITPRWDIEQYQILDWIAAAEPTRGLGALEITARIHNRGPRPQPYPQIQLQLKDRWEATVGSRVFHPSEYLDVATTGDALMSVGDTAQAHITVVDPGPDAYGFELDVCVEAEADELTCGNDEVFLR